MIYIIIIILTLLSCFIFDNLGVHILVQKLVKSYIAQFKLITDNTIDDEVKQKQLLTQISQQIGLIIRLIFRTQNYSNMFKKTN